MKNKVLLYHGISTAYADTDRSPSFSLMALSAYLKKKNYQVGLLLNKYSDQQLKLNLKNCLAVGFSVYTGNGILSSLNMARRIRKINPKIPLIWGGYHPTLEPEQTIKSKYIDFVIRGQGETTLEQLLDYFKNKQKSLKQIKGLTYKINQKIYHNQPAKPIDINHLPRLDYRLYHHVYHQSQSVGMITSRGCPFNCKFCCSAAFNRSEGLRYFQLSIDRIIGDIKYLLKQYSPDSIEFLDDNFFTSKKRVELFVKAYLENKFTFSWTAYARCDTFSRFDDILVKNLKKINLKKVFFGVESGSAKILTMVDKKITIGQVLASVRKISRQQILGDFTFINGFPKERKADVLKSLRLRKKIKSILPQATVRFFTYVPLPATETLKDCLSLGYQKPDKLTGWAWHEYHSFAGPWLKPAHKRLVNNIAWLALFDTIDLSLVDFLTRIIFKLLQIDSRFRFKTNFFNFMFEFETINKIYRRKLAKAFA